jgi:hypothetical protein
MSFISEIWGGIEKRTGIPFLVPKPEFLAASLVRAADVVDIHGVLMHEVLDDGQSRGTPGPANRAYHSARPSLAQSHQFVEVVQRVVYANFGRCMSDLRAVSCMSKP